MMSSCLPGVHEAGGGRAGQGLGEPRGGAEAEGGRRLLPDEAVDAGDLRRLGAQGAAAQPRRVRPHLRHRQPEIQDRQGKPAQAQGQLPSGDHSVVERGPKPEEPGVPRAAGHRQQGAPG